MIISGLQTGNTRWLAAHLLNAADNEEVELAEVTGTVAQDVEGALAEFDAYTAGTRAREGVYAAFINPPEPLESAQYMRALEVIEQRLGLGGQPRIVLFHVKNGRHHCHVVWSRIDAARMKAIQLSHDRQKLRRCARELAAEFGLSLPPGLAEDRGTERFKDRKRASKAEKSMAEISGLAVEDRREAITACYRQADSAEAFVNALEEAGYMLARGDRRAFVVIDIAGDVHSLSRQIDGAKTSDVRKALEGLDLSRVPSVTQAKAAMAQRAQAQADAARAKARKRSGAAEALKQLKIGQDKRKAALDLLWQQMKIRHMHERKVMLAHIKAEEELRLRRHWTQFGLALYLRKIAFIRQLLAYYEKKKRRSLEEFHRQMMESLQRRHENEARELRRRYDALERLERSERARLAIMHGTITAMTTSAAVAGRMAPELYADNPAAHKVQFGAMNVGDLDGWEETVDHLPDDFDYAFSAEPGSDGYDQSGFTVQFNMRAAGPRHGAQTDETKSGARARAPRGNGARPGWNVN